MHRIRQCDLVVTENCFLKCKMCHIWKHVRNDNQISFAEYSTFLHSLREATSGKMQIQFVGGEPLVKNGIVELVRLASSLGFQTTMTTNGLLVTEKTAEVLVQAGLDSLVFSLDSLQEKKHDYLRGTQGVCGAIMRALECLKKYSIPKIFIGTVITGYTMEDLVELAEWVNGQERIDSVYFQAIMQPFATEEDDLWYKTEEYRFLWPNADKAAEVMDQLAELKKKNYKIGNPTGQFEAFKAYFRDPQKFIKKIQCNLGYNSFTVLPDGNIFLCSSMGPIGNIKTDTINEVWFSEKADQVRRHIACCRNNCKLMINCFFEDEHA